MPVDVGHVFIILGMRRCGSSITRNLIGSHPKIDRVWFEPEIISFASRITLMKRFKDETGLLHYIDAMRPETGFVRGAKYVVNPGYEALSWENFDRAYQPKPRFVFIVRDLKDNFGSWHKANVNSMRGPLPFEIFKYFHERVNKSFIDFAAANKSRACVLSFERIVKNPNRELMKAWRAIGLEPPGIDLRPMIKTPRNWSRKR